MLLRLLRTSAGEGGGGARWETCASWPDAPATSCPAPACPLRERPESCRSRHTCPPLLRARPPAVAQQAVSLHGPPCMTPPLLGVCLLAWDRQDVPSKRVCLNRPWGALCSRMQILQFPLRPSEGLNLHAQVSQNFALQWRAALQQFPKRCPGLYADLNWECILPVADRGRGSPLQCGRERSSRTTLPRVPGISRPTSASQGAPKFPQCFFDKKSVHRSSLAVFASKISSCLIFRMFLNKSSAAAG